MAAGGPKPAAAASTPQPCCHQQTALRNHRRNYRSSSSRAHASYSSDKARLFWADMQWLLGTFNQCISCIIPVRWYIQKSSKFLHEHQTNRPALVHGISSLLGAILTVYSVPFNARCTSRLPVLHPDSSFSSSLLLPIFRPASTEPPLSLVQGSGQAQSMVAKPVPLLHMKDQQPVWLLFLLTYINRSQIFLKLSNGGSQQTGKGGRGTTPQKTTHESSFDRKSG